MNWKDKWYLIFGGSSGIGLAAARTLCGKGAHTVIVGRDREKLDRAVSGQRTAHPQRVETIGGK